MAVEGTAAVGNDCGPLEGAGSAGTVGHWAVGALRPLWGVRSLADSVAVWERAVASRGAGSAGALVSAAAVVSSAVIGGFCGRLERAVALGCCIRWDAEGAGTLGGTGPLRAPRLWGRCGRGKALRSFGAATPVGPLRLWGRYACGAATPVGALRLWGRYACGGATAVGALRSSGEVGGVVRSGRLDRGIDGCRWWSDNLNY